MSLFIIRRGKMTKIFEDEFMEVQSDMVSLCLEYIESKADNIYIYASNENNSLTFNVFFEIKGQIATTNEVNKILSSLNMKVDDSIERRRAILKIGVQDLQKIISICTKYNQPVPTEMKLVYNVNSNSLDAHYQYENIYSNTDKASYDIFSEWMQQIKNK
ncbi:hypothetical protein IV70_GL001147 [Carnobacterium maltaromaticum DSM 20342]|nr:hypothetical protein IV70_GL001147 [Carnobacterium maltaromaticum DSM 20342]